MQTKVIDLGVIRIDDVALIISQVVDYYERSLKTLSVIHDDEMDRLVQASHREMTKGYLAYARKMRDGLEDQDSRYSQMSVYGAAKHLATAAEWYGKCSEASQRAFVDREATITSIKRLYNW
jgi:hypothetical protein